jgi:hypothetical protein
MSEVELIEQAALRVGMKSLMNHGAASCVYTEGCEGVSQEHLIAFAREVALHCVAALATPTSAPVQEPVDAARVRVEPPMVAIAKRNLRGFLSKASFASNADREAALNCVDVLEGALAGHQSERPAPAGQAAEDAKKARRYEWLRSTTNSFTNDAGKRINVKLEPEKWDEMIDAALAASQAERPAEGGNG